MSLHRACCCTFVPADCSTAWSTCTTPVKVSLTGWTFRVLGTACDSGDISCDWDTVQIDEGFTCDLNNIEFAYNATFDRFDVVAAASNGGDVVFTFDTTGDAHEYNATLFGCDGSYIPDAAANLTFDLNDIPPDHEVRVLTGNIRSREISPGNCLFELTLTIEIYRYDGLDFTALEKSGSVQTTVSTSVGCGIRVELYATAPYSATLCPTAVSWTIQQASYFIIVDGYSSYRAVDAVPESSYVTDCPIGTTPTCAGADSSTPCYYVLGYDSEMSLYLPSIDASGFVNYTVDTPSLSVTI